MSARVRAIAPERPAAVAETDLEEVTRILARSFARLAVHVSGLQSRGAAGFRQIYVSELGLGSAEDAAVLERFLSGG